MKRTLSIILTVCMLIGLMGTFAFSDSVEQPTSVNITSGEFLDIVQNEVRYEGSHTGKIIVTGMTDIYSMVSEAGTYYIDFYDYSSLPVDNYYGLQVSKGATVYATFHGINTFVSDLVNGLGVVDNSKLIIDVAENSSVTFGSNDELCNALNVGAGSTVEMADGSALPEPNEDGDVVISNGTPANVEFTYGYVDDYTCAAKDGDIIVSTQEHAYDFIAKEEGHIYYCQNCEHEFTGLEAHDRYYLPVDENSCFEYCASCGNQKDPTPHVMTSYAYYDEDHCLNQCYNCGYSNVETGLVPHDYATTEHAATEGEAAYKVTECLHCGNSEKQYDDGDNIRFELYSEESYAWEDCGIVVLKNGIPITVVSNRIDAYYFIYEMPFDESASYQFLWVGRNTAAYSEDYGPVTDTFSFEIYLPGYEDVFYADYNVTENLELDLLCYYNMADYDEYFEALITIPESLEYYTKESTDKLKEVVKKMRWGIADQDKVDAVTAEIKSAVEGLVPTETPQSFGLLPTINDIIIKEKEGVKGYEVNGEFFPYDGEYVIFDPYGYTDINVTVDGVKADIALVETWFESESPIDIINGAEVTLTAVGSNIISANQDSYGAGITVDNTSKLTITDKSEGLLVVGDTDSAAIGGDDEDGLNDAGDITVNGGNIVVLSESDGAGIGGGHSGGVGTVTINGGLIFAECMSDDGSGIGTGDGGIGGDIIINGGNITAISLDDDGVGIGGADNGHTDSITINGGKIIVGSDDGAAIGGGDSTDSFGGKIIINGGILLEHDFNSTSSLIGNDEDNLKGEDEDNFVQINGGNIIADGNITPTPKNKQNKELERYEFEVEEALSDKDIVILLTDGTEIKATAYGKLVSIYIPVDATLASVVDAKHEHVFTIYVYNNDATCTEDGTKTAKCDSCSATDTVKAENTATGHKFTNYVYNNDATCCDDGTKTAKCDFCDATDTVKAENTAKGHDDTSKVFSDVKEKGWYRKAIDYNYTHNFIAGESKTEFGVNNKVTRGMFITILARMAGVDTSKEANKAAATKFTDVKTGKYYSAAIKWALDNNIVAGVTDTEFRPDAPIERQQLCVMLVNFAKHQNIEIKASEDEINFADAGKISKYAKAAVKTCQTADIVNGYNEDGKVEFRARNTATRAEAAQILYKFHKDFA